MALPDAEEDTVAAGGLVYVAHLTAVWQMRKQRPLPSNGSDQMSCQPCCSRLCRLASTIWWGV